MKRKQEWLVGWQNGAGRSFKVLTDGPTKTALYAVLEYCARIAATPDVISVTVKKSLSGGSDMRQDDKTKMLARAAKRFITASNRLVNAELRLRQAPGARSATKAQINLDQREEEYTEAEETLRALIEELG